MIKLPYPHTLRREGRPDSGLFRFCFREDTLYVHFFMCFLKVVFFKAPEIGQGLHSRLVYFRTTKRSICLCASGVLAVGAKLISHFIFISFSMKFSHLEKKSNNCLIKSCLFHRIYCSMLFLASFRHAHVLKQ